MQGLLRPPELCSCCNNYRGTVWTHHPGTAKESELLAGLTGQLFRGLRLYKGKSNDVDCFLPFDCKSNDYMD